MIRTALAASGVALSIALPVPAQVVFSGGEFAVNSTTAGSQFQPAVAVATDGSFVAVWNSSGTDGDAGGIYARRFTAAAVPAGGEFRVNTTTAGDQSSPAAATADDGTTMIVWAGANQDGNGYGIAARIFDAAGNPRTGEFVVDTTSAGNQTTPKVAAAGGGFVVVWTGPAANDPSNFEIFLRRFSTAGSALADETRVNVNVGDAQIQPAIGATIFGGFAIAWASQINDNSGYGIAARLFDANGAALTGDILVNVIQAFDQTAPAVAGTTDGGFVVAWETQLQASPTPLGPQPTVLARRFDAAGAPAGGEIHLSPTTGVQQDSPSIAPDGEGGFVVAWQRTTTLPDNSETRDLYARQFDVHDTPETGEFLLNSTLANDQIAPALATGGSGLFVALWASFAQDGSSFGIFGQRLATSPTPCVADAKTLCLNAGRFRVKTHWRTVAGATGDGHAQSLTADTGFFWFFDATNLELVVKVLDTCGSAFDDFWVFAGGLTNVETALEVEDTLTGTSRVYLNPQSTAFQPLQDTDHFHVCGAAAPAAAAGEAAGAARAESSSASASSLLSVDSFAAPGTCVANDTTLCAQGTRFAITVDWRTQAGASGPGHATSLTPDTGYFWFFSSTNVELVVKVLDTCGSNFNDFWVFAGGLTNVETTITVRDTLHPEVPAKVYVNPLGTAFEPLQDTEAFATCP